MPDLDPVVASKAMSVVVDVQAELGRAIDGLVLACVAIE
jgi:hypothetical protein